MVYLATEHVEPLHNRLTDKTESRSKKELYFSWGIFQITVRTSKDIYIYILYKIIYELNKKDIIYVLL